MNNKILYVGRSGLPIDASGVRTYQIGSLLERAGYNLHYLADRCVSQSEKNSCYEQINATGFLAPDEVHFGVGEKIYSYLPTKKSGKLGVLLAFYELKSAKQVYRRVVSYCRKEHPVAIILYNDPGGLTRRLVSYCKKSRIRLYADVTEWYEYSNAKNLGEKMVARFVNRRILKTDKNLDGVIAISPFLKKIYDEQGVPCIQIPPLMEIPDATVLERFHCGSDSAVVNIVYAGSPGGKDILLPFVKAVQNVNGNGVRIRLDIVGIDSSYFGGIMDVDQNLAQTGIFAHGRLSRAETLEFVKKADFGILFRHDLRYAKAGFSTKFAECMSLGVPMICNSIGGCDTMILHGKTGFLTDSCEVEELKNLLLKILEMPRDEILSMKKDAYEFAKEHFKGENYFEELMAFMNLQPF